MFYNILLIMLCLIMLAAIVYFTIVNTRTINDLKARVNGEDTRTSNRLSSMVSGINYNDERLHLATNILANDIDMLNTNLNLLQQQLEQNTADINLLKTSLSTVYPR